MKIQPKGIITKVHGSIKCQASSIVSLLLVSIRWPVFNEW